MAVPNPLALAFGYASDPEESDSEKEKKEKEEDKHRPGYGRGYFADPDASKGPESASNAEKDGDKTRNETGTQVGKKRPLPKATDLLSTKITPAFIAHTLAAKQQHAAGNLGHVKLYDRPMEPPPKKKGLLDRYEEKKLKHKAVASRYHITPSEVATFVEPVRERNAPSKETGDIGWLEVFARRSKRSAAPQAPPIKGKMPTAKDAFGFD